MLGTCAFRRILHDGASETPTVVARREIRSPDTRLLEVAIERCKIHLTGTHVPDWHVEQHVGDEQLVLWNHVPKENRRRVHTLNHFGDGARRDDRIDRARTRRHCNVDARVAERTAARGHLLGVFFENDRTYGNTCTREREKKATGTRLSAAGRKIVGDEQEAATGRCRASTDARKELRVTLGHFFRREVRSDLRRRGARRGAQDCVCDDRSVGVARYPMHTLVTMRELFGTEHVGRDQRNTRRERLEMHEAQAFECARRKHDVCRGVERTRIRTRAEKDERVANPVRVGHSLHARGHLEGVGMRPHGLTQKKKARIVSARSKRGKHRRHAIESLLRSVIRDRENSERLLR